MTKVQGLPQVKVAQYEAGSLLFPLRQRWSNLVVILCFWPIGCEPPVAPASPTTPLVSRPAPTAPNVPSSPYVAVAPQGTTLDESTSIPSESRSRKAVGWRELSLDGFEPSLVYYQPQAPKFVITHGAGGQAKWHCEHYQRILGANATLLCPQGKRRYARDPTRGYYYPDHLTLAREVDAMLRQFETEFEPREPNEQYVFAGYSQGATMGALAFAPQGNRFSYLVLVEGGYADFSLTLAKQFKNAGGKGALFICGTQSCRDKSRVAVSSLRQMGLEGEVRWAPGAGHRPDGPVTKALVSALPFVLSSDRRWNDFIPKVPEEEVLRGNG